MVMVMEVAMALEVAMMRRIPSTMNVILLTPTSQTTVVILLAFVSNVLQMMAHFIIVKTWVLSWLYVRNA